MSLAAEAIQSARRALQGDKVMTGDQLMRLMACSVRTVQRRLRQWGCHTSFNHNGRYYALPQVVRFDDYGIWACRSVCFSRFGNLSKTVTGVIHEADHGLSAGELAQRLHVNVHGFLSQFAARALFTREPLGGTFRYFSTDPTRAAQQRESYLASGADPPALRLGDAAAVKLLLAWINDPDADAAALSHTLQQQQVRASPEAVARFLHQHSLGTKKNTA